MADNVKQGFRAGGRAPVGYKLESIPTGAVRDGAPVTKSKLVPAESAQKIQAYLKGRATGQSGSRLMKEIGLAILQHYERVEWNALTYASHTVWNVHNETSNEGDVGTKSPPGKNELSSATRIR